MNLKKKYWLINVTRAEKEISAYKCDKREYVYRNLKTTLTLKQSE